MTQGPMPGFRMGVEVEFHDSGRGWDSELRSKLGSCFGVDRTGVMGRVSKPESGLGFGTGLGIGKRDRGMIMGMGSRSRMGLGDWVRFQNRGGAGFWDRGLGRVLRRGQGQGLFRDNVEVRVGFRDRDRGSWLGFGTRSGSSFEKEDRGRWEISRPRSRLGFGMGVKVGFWDQSMGPVSRKGWGSSFGMGVEGQISGSESRWVSRMELWSSFEIEVEVKFQDGVRVGFRDTGRGWVFKIGSGV
ncbi:hypothetical protein TIFTF001_039110 [Ficus carica]|uniref:Uncharacterized protein n=1 Tax=Ficus carica TaxID=3494 RepID=A0AA88EA59_FICCA|nr:hypothetical protein TIFTF001_039108 [Ficus carica]GMN70066.1 hypothetical protein TIFTF001_039110 [Ficus carica]